MARTLPVIALALLSAATLAAMQRAQGPAAAPPSGALKGLTAVDGLKVGHFTLSERPTGCTVVLVDGTGATGGVSQRGGAPGTRETDPNYDGVNVYGDETTANIKTVLTSLVNRHPSCKGSLIPCQQTFPFHEPVTAKTRW